MKQFVTMVWTLFLLVAVIAEENTPTFVIQEIEKYDTSTPVTGSFDAYGKLEKTGKQLSFTTYSYKQNVFFVRKYYVTNPLDNTLINHSWVQAQGVYHKSVAARVEITISNCQSVIKWNKKIATAVQDSRKWVIANLPKYDLNNFKNTERFRLALSHLHKTNLNSSKYLPQINKSPVIYADFNNMIIGIDCGKSLLFRNEIRGDFLSYVAVYDIKKQKLLCACVINTGYYLE
jgi:hypothetical protein